MRGYQMAYFMTTASGDYLRVDFNLKEKRIRLFIEDANEGGNPYYAVVTNGKVMTEKNVTTGRESGVMDRLVERAEYFNTLPPRDVRNAVRAVLDQQRKPSAKSAEVTDKKEGRQELLERTRRRYFKEEDAQGFETGEPSIRREAPRLFKELIDVILGLAICMGLYFYNRDFVIVGITAGVFGMGIGAFDMLVRGREPSVIKVILFLAAGLTSYVYGYYYF